MASIVTWRIRPRNRSSVLKRRSISNHAHELARADGDTIAPAFIADRTGRDTEIRSDYGNRASIVEIYLLECGRIDRDRREARVPQRHTAGAQILGDRGWAAREAACQRRRALASGIA